MERFTYNLKAPVETVEDFNLRLHDFCAGQPVLDMAFGIDMRGMLLISLTTADDVTVQMATCQMPHVALLGDADYANLEERLEQIAAAILATSTTDNPRIPMAQQIVEREGCATVLVTRINYGLFLVEEEEEGTGQ